MLQDVLALGGVPNPILGGKGGIGESFLEEVFPKMRLEETVRVNQLKVRAEVFHKERSTC